MWRTMRAGGKLVICLGVAAAGFLAFSVPILAQDNAPAPAIATVTPAEAAFANPKQAALLQQQFAALAPQKKGATDIYALGIAGWAKQDVFMKELDGALASIGKVLPLQGTLRLISHPDTVQTIPLASRQNIAAAVRAVGRVIDKEEDVLLIFMTSHGTKQGFALQLPGLSVQLSPAELAAVLKKQGIKNYVVIVSACYSGVFVKPLANDNAIVLTAADEKSASFGCISGRDWTYFGDALFNQTLKPGMDFKEAFNRARTLIQGWERLDRLAASNPQAHFGSALVRKLEPLFKTHAAADN